MPTVTAESIKAMLENSNPAYVQAVIGRALVVIFNNQTTDEQDDNSTNKSNGIGFTGADAYSGSLTAKFYLKHKRLEDWMVDKWAKPNRKGVPRLAKYHGQLNRVTRS